MKKFFRRLLGTALMSTVTLSACVPSFANFGMYYSYRLFEMEDWHTVCERAFECCPEEIIHIIESDDVDKLVKTLLRLNLDASSLLIRFNDVEYSHIYNCFLCFGGMKRDDDFGDVCDEMSLLEYALSCGSIKCSRYLILNKVTSRSENVDDLMLYAIVSGNAELIRLTEQMGASLNINDLYIAMRMAFTGNIEDRAHLIEWIIESGITDTLMDDQAEKALAFLLLAEKNCADEKIIKTSLEDFKVGDVVEKLIDLCCKEGFSQNLAATIVAASNADLPDLPLYIKLKEKLHEYILQADEDEKLNLMGGPSIKSVFNGLVRSGNVKLVKDLIDLGIDINQRDEFGYNALSDAVMNNDVEMTKMLLEAGSNVHLAGKDIFTPLRLAKIRENDEIIDLLIAYGANEEQDIFDYDDIS